MALGPDVVFMCQLRTYGWVIQPDVAYSDCSAHAVRVGTLYRSRYISSLASIRRMFPEEVSEKNVEILPVRRCGQRNDDKVS
jgi:hypothetical protein